MVVSRVHCLALTEPLVGYLGPDSHRCICPFIGDCFSDYLPQQASHTIRQIEARAFVRIALRQTVIKLGHSG